VFLYYLLSLMIGTRKHSLKHASALSGLNKSQFSRLLSNHTKTAVYTIESLSKKQAKICSKVLKKLGYLPWQVAILIDSTIQKRSSLHSENVQRFNHGKGFVIGHQWTNVVLIINGILIPLPPIAFHTKKYCRQYKLVYKTEHKLLVEYLNTLDLRHYIGPYSSKTVVVIADSGYDDKKIQNAIRKRGWCFIISLKNKRSVKSPQQWMKTPRSSGWSQVAQFFKDQRRLAWETVCLEANSKQQKRMDVRIRHTTGFLKDVGKVQLVCSELKKRPDGRRKFFACSDLEVQARHIVIGYRLRWGIELFHKAVKMHLGFEHVAAKHFCSVVTHVHLVYCAYILLHAHPPGISESSYTIPEKQQNLQTVLANAKIANVLQQLTQIGGVRRYKDQLKQALTASSPLNPLSYQELNC
jgi:mRNA-degrading endonuclease RelE of RelBE toxin-antitoxin system